MGSPSDRDRPRATGDAVGGRGGREPPSTRIFSVSSAERSPRRSQREGAAGSRTGVSRCIWAWKKGSGPPRRPIPRCSSRTWTSCAEALSAAGHEVRFDDEIPEVRRCYVDDPFGNRIELIEC